MIGSRRMRTRSLGGLRTTLPKIAPLQTTAGIQTHCTCTEPKHPQSPVDTYGIFPFRTYRVWCVLFEGPKQGAANLNTFLKKENQNNNIQILTYKHFTVAICTHNLISCESPILQISVVHKSLYYNFSPFSRVWFGALKRSFS